jgi:hypothetical protein
MRAGVKDSDIFGGYKELTGVVGFTAISLGWDFVAEHEWGIKDILQDFGCNSKKTGFDSHKITKLSDIFYSGEMNILLPQETTERSLLVLASAYSIKDTPFSVTSYMTHRFHDDDLNFDYWSAWDGKGFVLVLEDTPTSKVIYEALQTAFKKKDIAIFTSGKDNPFSGAGFMLAIYSRIPKKAIDEVKKASIVSDLLQKRMNSSSAFKALLAKTEEWTKEHPGCDSPYTYMFLGNPHIEGLGLKYWLNPEHQSYMNAAWVTDKDLMDWVEGEPGRIIKSQALWDELLWMCTKVSYRSNLIGSGLHKFNRYPAQHMQPKGKGYYADGHWGEDKYWIAGSNMPKALNKEKKLTPEFVQYVEQHIKQLLITDLRDQFRYNCSQDLTKLQEVTHIRRETDERVYGFFEALRLMGYETNEGACNTPEVRENFSWWRSLLGEEAFWDFWIELGVAYEPWVRNGYTEVTRIRYHQYKNHKWNDSDYGLSVLKDKLETDTDPIPEE